MKAIQTYRSFGLNAALSSVAEIASYAALGAVAAYAGWALLAPVGSGAGGADVLPGSTGPTTSNDIASTFGRDPFFATASGSMQAPALQTVDGFTLHATRVDSTGAGTAILSVQGAAQAMYAVGDRVGDAILVRVESDQVVLDLGGHPASVTFPGAHSSVLVSASKPVSQQAPAEALPASRSELLRTVGFKSVATSTGNIGLEISPGTNPSVLASTGMQAGDVIVDVNGMELTATNITHLRDQILSGGEVDLKVQRGGKIVAARLSGVI